MFAIKSGSSSSATKRAAEKQPLNGFVASPPLSCGVCRSVPAEILRGRRHPRLLTLE